MIDTHNTHTQLGSSSSDLPLPSLSSFDLDSDPDYIDPLIPLAPTPSNLSHLIQSFESHPLHSSSLNLQSLRRVCTHAYLRAASTGDSDLLDWLLSSYHHHHHHHHHPNLTSLPPRASSITPSDHHQDQHHPLPHHHHHRRPHQAFKPPTSYHHSSHSTTTTTTSTTTTSSSSSPLPTLPASASIHSPPSPSSSSLDPHPKSLSRTHPSSSNHPPILNPGHARRWIDLEARDDDGSPAIVLAAAFGHAEAVRAIVDGLGDHVVNSRDAVGWTALHWAARNGDLTIVSYLLNHGASTSLLSFTDPTPTDRPSSVLTHSSSHSRMSSLSTSTLDSDHHPSSPFNPTADHDPNPPSIAQRRKRRRTRHRGLRPYDLTKRDECGETIREILRIAEQAKANNITLLNSRSRPQSQASIRSIRLAEVKSEADLARSESKKIIQLVQLTSQTLQIDPILLGLEPPPPKPQPLISIPSDQDPSLPTGLIIRAFLDSFNTDWEAEQRAEEFDWDRCLPHQMLVCSLVELPAIFEAVIDSIEPRQARPDRLIPANVLTLCARFAAHMDTIELLEEVLLGAVDRIEEIIFARQENMAHSTFWLFNSICLLYYLRTDPVTRDLTPDVQLHLEDLVNEIYVFIVRDAERRLDRLIDCAILDFEPLPDMVVDFEPEGSWSFVRALTVKRNRTTSRAGIPRFHKPITNPSNPPPPPPTSKPPLPSTSSTPKAPPGGGHGSRTVSLPSSHSTRETAPSSQQPSTSPKLVTDLLSSVLCLLQAYEIHPSVIVQTFSQIFYWLSCETFNRIISRRKYLCRSKAMQISLNVRSIEEWARSNRLPPKVISKHFEPLNQLLQWIQCLSTYGAQSFDRLIELVSTRLKKLNPTQLLKVFKDYRFEIDESKLSEECRQYLVQTQQDWDRRRIQRVNELEEKEQIDQRTRHPSSDQLHPPESGVGSRSLLSTRPGPSAGLQDPLEAVEEEDLQHGAEKDIKDEALKRAIEAIDLAFGQDRVESFESYEPPSVPECLGELLDSRQMLPFGLPSSNQVLMSLKRTVPFGSLKTYIIPDDPKPGDHWWASSMRRSPSLSEEFDEDEEDDDEYDGAEDQEDMIDPRSPIIDPQVGFSPSSSSVDHHWSTDSSQQDAKSPKPNEMMAHADQDQEARWKGSKDGVADSKLGHEPPSNPDRSRLNHSQTTICYLDSSSTISTSNHHTIHPRPSIQVVPIVSGLVLNRIDSFLLK